MSALSELADRCEVATGPDRELDIAILTTAAGYRDVDGGGRMFDRGNDGYWFVDDCSIYQLPSPTASLDAAMTLVPEGFRFYVDSGTLDSGDSHACAFTAQDSRISGGCKEAATPALALCAAALRARAQITQPRGESSTASPAASSAPARSVSTPADHSGQTANSQRIARDEAGDAERIQP